MRERRELEVGGGRGGESVSLTHISHCRVGGKDNFFHCDRCGYCLPVSMKDTHLCRQQASRDNCPVCMEVCRVLAKAC